MPGIRGKLLIGTLAIAVAAPASALAAQETVVAGKSRAVSPASLDPVASAAKKKKKKKKAGPPVTTQSSQVAFAAGSAAGTAAACTGNTHVAGGGYAISPSFSPPATGLRSITSTNHPTAPQGWNASGAAFTTPTVSGSFTTYAQCESNSLSKLAGVLTQSVSLPPASAQTFNFNCPPGTHALTGGYAGTSLAAFNPSATNFRILPLQSHRVGATTWVVQAANSSFSPAAAVLTAYAVCEKDARGRTITEVSTLNALADDSRAIANPTCTGKTHVVSGGFVLSPNAPGPAGIPSVGIDEFQPVGKSVWHLGLHEFVGLVIPAGSTLQTSAYCAPDSLPKKKKKKK